METLCRLHGRTLTNTVSATLSSQEEVGERGMTCVMNNVKPDVVICFEGCPADDSFEEEYMIQSALKKGPMLRHFDRSMITSPRFQRFALELAHANDIPVQESVRKGGGTNGGITHLSLIHIFSFLPVFFTLLYQTPIPWLFAVSLIIFWFMLLLSRKGVTNGHGGYVRLSAFGLSVICVLLTFFTSLPDTYEMRSTSGSLRERLLQRVDELASVSYTHLDVYKRQKACRSTDTEAYGCDNCFHLCYSQCR